MVSPPFFFGSYMSVLHKKTNLSSKVSDIRKMGFSYDCIKRMLPLEMQVTTRSLHRYSKGGIVQSWKVERELNNLYEILYQLILENKLGEIKNGEKETI